MVEGWGVKGRRGGVQGLADPLDEGKEGGAIEGEGCTTAGKGAGGIGKGGELGAGEMVSVHWDEGGYGGCGSFALEGRVKGIEAVAEGCCEGGFA